MQKGFVYILKSLNCSRYYIGSTNNVDRRLKEHNNGSVTATHNKGPWTVCFEQQYDSIQKARRIEHKLKKHKSRVLIDRIIADGKITME